MSRLVCFVEGRAEKVLLAEVLSRMKVGGPEPIIIAFDGKQDLEKQLVRRMRGWTDASARFLVVRDQDAGSCKDVKARLVGLCKSSGKKTFLVRIACHEMESFYLGDLAAVEDGLNVTGLREQQQRRKFRNPDAVPSPKQELKRLTAGVYQEIAGSRAIARHLDLWGGNRSQSFGHLLTAIRNFGAT
jgi:hypothetical protein